MTDLFILIRWYASGGLPHISTADQRTIIEYFRNAYDAHTLGVLKLADMHVYRVSRPGSVVKVYDLQKIP